MPTICKKFCSTIRPDTDSPRWCNRLPQEGNYFEEAIALLERLSIVANAARIDANRVGTSIRETLLQPLISGRAVNDQGATPKLHLASESVYNRIPVVVPYDSPIQLYVQAGDIVGLRELWQTGLATIDTVDPYGLGLLYVRPTPQMEKWQGGRGRDTN